MISPQEFDLRYSELDDLVYLETWFSSPEAFDSYPFSFEDKEEVLKNWIGFSKFKASLTAVIDQIPCGIGTLFLMPYRKVAHHCSFQLFVDPKYRRQGIGSSLIKNLCHLAHTKFGLEGVCVEMYEPNPISSLLQKQGFKVFARQENYLFRNGQFYPRVLWERFRV